MYLENLTKQKKSYMNLQQQHENIDHTWKFHKIKLGSLCRYRSTNDVKQKKQKTEHKRIPNED